MKPSFLVLAFTSTALASVSQGPMQDDRHSTDLILDRLQESKIIPEVLDTFEPTILIDAYYTDHQHIQYGNIVSPKKVTKRPVFTINVRPFSPFQPHKFYTLILTDPDAKSRDNPKWSEMCHWILTNVTSPIGYDAGSMVEESAELVGYKAPAPPKTTGLHRYVFVLLAGDNPHPKPPKARKHWGYKEMRHGVRQWANENQLKVVGANFFYAMHDQ